MARAVVKVTSLSLVCCGVGYAVACSNGGTDGGLHAHASDDPPPAAPSATASSPATPAKPTTLYRFQGTANVAARTMQVTFTTPSGQVVKTDEQLPYGNGPNEVYAHTLPGSVVFDTSSTPGCLGTAGDPHLCGRVGIVNGYGSTVSGVSVVFTGFAPTGAASAVGAPYSYGDVSGGGSSVVLEWVFDDPTSENFSFDGEVDGTPPSDAGGAGCTTNLECTNGEHCDIEDGQCYPCVTDGQCPAGQACENFSCQSCILNNECTTATESTECCGGTPYCVEENCEECAHDFQCHDGSRPYCEPSIFICVQCLDGSQCASGQTCNGGLCVN